MVCSLYFFDDGQYICSSAFQSQIYWHLRWFLAPVSPKCRLYLWAVETTGSVPILKNTEIDWIATPKDKPSFRGVVWRGKKIRKPCLLQVHSFTHMMPITVLFLIVGAVIRMYHFFSIIRQMVFDFSLSYKGTMCKIEKVPWVLFIRLLKVPPETSKVTGLFIYLGSSLSLHFFSECADLKYNCFYNQRTFWH